MIWDTKPGPLPTVVAAMVVIHDGGDSSSGTSVTGDQDDGCGGELL